MAANNSLLEITAVSHMYGGTAALNDVTLQIYQGEFLSIIGPSGCGKSTLLKIMAGIISPTRGEVRYCGRLLSAFPPPKHGILMVWQSLALFPHLNVGGNVGFGLAVRGTAPSVRSQRVATALDLVQLSGFEHRSVNTLSGGEQQRVALARALVLEPTVLLLDEPMQGLDRHLRSQLIGTIRELHHRLEVTMVMVTHDQSEARLLSNRIAVMRAGQIEQTGAPNMLLNQPENKFVAEFVGDRNIFPGRVQKIDGEVVTVETPLGELKAVLPGWLPFSPAKGTSVAYVVDAHKICIGGSYGTNTANAVVEAVVENGISETVELASAGVRIIRCQRAKAPMGGSLVLGQRVTLSWHSLDAYILPN